MVGNNAADKAAAAAGGGGSGAPAPVASPAQPASASIIDFSSKTQAGKLRVRVHWGLLFAIGASLALWLLIWAVARLLF